MAKSWRLHLTSGMFTSERIDMKAILIGFGLLASYALTAQTKEFFKETAFNGQRIKIEADLANSITLSESSNNLFQSTVWYNLNDGELNEAVEVNLSEKNGSIRLKVKLNERKARSKNGSDCKDESASWWGDEWGGRVCADIQIEIKIPSGARIEIETVIADIALQGDYEEVDVKSVTGNIDLDWPEEKGVQLEMKTVNGAIFTNYNFGPSGKYDLPLISAHEFEVEWGDARHYVRLETVTSDIYLRRR